MIRIVYLSYFFVFFILLLGCNTVKFSSKSSKGSDHPVGPNTNTSNTSNPQISQNPQVVDSTPQSNSEVIKEIVNKCKPQETLVGAIIAFVIDNSNSNGVSDCPQAQILGYSGSAPIYKCKEQTKREKAILSAHQILGGIGKLKTQDISQSTISVSSFPTKSNIYNGWKINQKWLNPSKYDLNSIQKNLLFTREPVGETPYYSGLYAAYTLFKKVSKSSSKEKVVFFITDGFPTDKDPQKILSIANNLKNLGVKIDTVFVIDSQTRTNQVQNHKKELLSKGYSVNSVDLLLGLNGKKSVLEQISNEIIDISNFNLLEKMIQNLIKKHVTCQ